MSTSKEPEEEWIEGQFYSNFPTKEQVIQQKVGTWDFTPYFKDNVKKLISQAKSQGAREALGTASKELKERYGKDSGPALVVIECLEGSVEQRPALQEVISILQSNLNKVENK